MKELQGFKEGDFVDLVDTGRCGRVSLVLEQQLVVVSGDEVLLLRPDDVVHWSPGGK